MPQIKYVFDACAIVAFLREETGGEFVCDILEKHQGNCAVHAINLCEVFYDAVRKSGEDKARVVLSDLNNIGLVVSRDLDTEFITEVGLIKAKNKLSLADAFAVALAKHYNAELLTSDHHELDAIAKSGKYAIRFIR